MHYATRDELAKLDELAVKNGLQIKQMMELAGFHILSLFDEMNYGKDKSVVVVVGKGNKGGDGLCAARHLINRGFEVHIILLSKENSPDAEHHLSLLKNMKARVHLHNMGDNVTDRILKRTDVIIDAMIGYNLSGAPRGEYAKIIEKVNLLDKNIVAYDIPTGIDATAGECFDPYIKADATLTLALPKKAFKREKARAACGKLFLGDIGIPRFIYDEISPGSRPDFDISSKLTLSI